MDFLLGERPIFDEDGGGGGGGGAVEGPAVSHGFEPWELESEPPFLSSFPAVDEGVEVPEIDFLWKYGLNKQNSCTNNNYCIGNSKLRVNLEFGRKRRGKRTGNHTHIIDLRLLHFLDDREDGCCCGRMKDRLAHWISAPRIERLLAFRRQIRLKSERIRKRARSNNTLTISIGDNQKKQQNL